MNRNTPYFDGDDAAIEIQVLNRTEGYQLVETIHRVPIKRSGWWAIRYKGQQFPMHGGIRNPLFIAIPDIGTN